MLLPGERSINAVLRDCERDDLMIRIRREGPRRVYAGLLWYAQLRDFKPGWASFCFKEIFGTWPRPQDKGHPVQWLNIDLELWIAKRKKLLHREQQKSRRVAASSG